MAAIPEHVKLFIVERLACFDTPTEVAEAVKEEFSLDLERNHVGNYDPTKEAGKQLGKKWKAVFSAKRKAFLEDMEDIPLANMSVRVRELQKNYEKLKKAKNYLAANQVLEQIAKEVGGSFTNKVKLTGGDKGDTPIQQEVSVTRGRLSELRKKNVK